LFSVLVAVILVLLTGFLLVNFNTSAFFIGERMFLPALIYTLITCYFIDFQILNPALPAAVFLILALRKIVESYKVQGTAYSLFDAGLLIGLGSLFYASLIWFGLLFIIGIALLRTGNIKEVIISFIGLAAPLFIVYGFLYVSGQDIDSLQSAVTYNLFGRDAHYPVKGLKLVVLVVSGLLVMISFFHLLSGINNKKIKSRKTFILFFWTLFIATVVYFLSGAASVEIQWLAMIPPTYFISHYFVFSRGRWLPDTMLVLLFVLAAVIQASGLIG
jgi:hypothetical protein